VGTPIARWQPDEAGPPSPAKAPETRRPAAVTEPKASVAPERPATRAPRPDTNRVLATPYARKLARQNGIDIAIIAGTGPGSRIKAADVERALATAPNPPVVVTLPLASSVPVPAPASGRDLSLVTTDVDVGRLREIDRSLKAAHLAVEGPHLIALACLRALALLEDGCERVPIGLEAETPTAGTRLVTVHASPRLSLSALAGHIVEAQRRAGQAGPRPEEAVGGRLVILAGTPATRVFGPAVPSGWAMALGLGAVRDVFRPGSDGSPVLAHEMTLALSYAASDISHAAALELLARIKALLEEPLAMFV
jgi:pyruvate dehydrogenase E2 component (dihydrolipoamide acetyltransferase)